MLLVEGGKIRACKEQHQLVKLVRKAFRDEDIHTDGELLESYLALQKYYHFNLFPWEVFVMGLHLCTFRADGLPRWPDLFTLVGRGAGKDGYIGFQSFCLVSPYNKVRQYNVDICANSELQAKTPFDDVHSVLESPEHHRKLKRFLASEVLFFQLNSRNMKRITDAMFSSYSKLISYAMNAFQQSRGRRGVLKADAMFRGNEEERQKIVAMVQGWFKQYFEADNAVLPLVDELPKEAGMDQLTVFHHQTFGQVRTVLKDGLRKTFGYHYYKQTGDIAFLMIWFNHSSVEVTKRYIGIDLDERAKKIRKFEI